VPVIIELKPPQPLARELRLTHDGNAVRRAIQDALADGDRVAVACTRKDEAEQLHEHLTQQGLTVGLVTSGTQRVADYNTFAAQHSAVVFTTAAGAGVSIDERFDRLFVLHGFQDIGPREVLQMVGRVRNLTNPIVDVYVPQWRVGHEPESADFFRLQAEQRGDRLDDAALLLRSELEAESARKRNRPFLQAYNGQPWPIREPESVDDPTAAPDDYREAGRTVRDEAVLAILAAEDITPQEAERIELARDASPKERAALQRHQLAEVVGCDNVDQRAAENFKTWVIGHRIERAAALLLTARGDGARLPPRLRRQANVIACMFTALTGRKPGQPAAIEPGATYQLPEDDAAVLAAGGTRSVTPGKKRWAWVRQRLADWGFSNRDGWIPTRYTETMMTKLTFELEDARPHWADAVRDMAPITIGAQPLHNRLAMLGATGLPANPTRLGRALPMVPGILVQRGKSNGKRVLRIAAAGS